MDNQCETCGAVTGINTFNLWSRAKAYARDQLNKRTEKKANGEKLNGITNQTARAFFHGYVCGSREERRNDT